MSTYFGWFYTYNLENCVHCIWYYHLYVVVSKDFFLHHPIENEYFHHYLHLALTSTSSTDYFTMWLLHCTIMLSLGFSFKLYTGLIGYGLNAFLWRLFDLALIYTFWFNQMSLITWRPILRDFMPLRSLCLNFSISIELCFLRFFPPSDKQWIFSSLFTLDLDINIFNWWLYNVIISLQNHVILKKKTINMIFVFQHVSIHNWNQIILIMWIKEIF